MPVLIRGAYLARAASQSLAARKETLLYNSPMPELSRFFGIIIRMYLEISAPHHIPHFHAYYQEDIAVYTIEPIELISGTLPRRQQRLVEAWAELHREELMVDWYRLQAGQKPLPIAPLN